MPSTATQSAAAQMETLDESSTSSKFFTIQNPIRSSAPIEIHTLIHTSRQSVKDVCTPPTIIALHYWGGSASTFCHVPALLQRMQITLSQHCKASTVVSISHRGWGLSSPAAPDTPSAYSIFALASDIIDLLSQLRSDDLIPSSGYILCGHSMGGKVAIAVSQMISSALPQDFPPLRATLLLAPAPPTPLVLPEDMREQQIHAYDFAQNIEWTVQNVLTGSHGDQLYGGQDDFNAIVKDSLRGSHGAKKGWPFNAMAEEIDIKQADQDQKNAHFRVLVSRGDRVETLDRVVRETVEVLRAKGYPTRLRVLEGADTNQENGGIEVGHLLPLEAPKIVAEELLDILLEFSDRERRGAL